MIPLILLSGALSLAAGCDAKPAAADAAPPPPSAEARARVQELIEVYSPLDRTVTSNVQDVQFARQVKLLEELSNAPPEVGRAALEALRRDEKRPVDVERALITVAAHSATADTLPFLVSVVTQYGAEMSLRTEALLQMAEVAPEKAIEVLQPIVTLHRQEKTMPPQEFLVKAWVIACDQTGRSPVPELCDVATDLFQEGYARVLAVKELGRRRDPRGEAALRAILIESTGDGYLRRKTVQSLHAILPAETACVLFREVASKEQDMNFLRFLADAIEDWCGQ